MTNGGTGTTQERLDLRDRLMEMRTALGEAELTLRRDREISSDDRAKKIKKINRSHTKINTELGRLNEDAIKARDNDPEVLELIQGLDAAYDELVVARETMRKATARTREVVEVVGKVDKVLKVFGGLALKIASVVR